MQPETIDITPSPRVLRMLGQIDFAAWQCLAELIDNSIDAFLEAQRGEKPLTLDPNVSIELPSGVHRLTTALARSRCPRTMVQG